MPRKAASDKTEKPKLKVVPPTLSADQRDPLSRAEQFEREVTAELLERAGREGHEQVGAIGKAVIKLAALQFSAAQALFEEGLQTGDRQLLSAASTMSGGARLNLVSAHNLIVSQAKALREDEESEGTREFYRPGKSA